MRTRTRRTHIPIKKYELSMNRLIDQLLVPPAFMSQSKALFSMWLAVARIGSPQAHLSASRRAGP